MQISPLSEETFNILSNVIKDLNTVITRRHSLKILHQIKETKLFSIYYWFLLTLDEIDEIELPTSPVSPEELQAAIIQETTMAVAVKSEIVPTKKVQQKSIEELSSLGVGTFSIDKDTAKNMASGRFVKRIKIKRCGKCKVNFLFFYA